MNKMNYLMIKKCTINGKKYLCKKTTKCQQDAINYKGSGLIIKRLKNKYGKDCIVHESILCVMPYEKNKEFRDFCYKMSLHLDVVNSDEWLNLEHEMGGGGSTVDTNKSKGRKAMFKNNIQKYIKDEEIDNYLKEGWAFGFTEKLRNKLSESLKGKRAHNKGKKMKQEHEYKTKLKQTKTEEEKFINRSNARKKLYKDPSYLAIFKKPRKPLLLVLNPNGNENLISRSELVKMGVSLRTLLKGNTSKGWRLKI